MARIRKPRQEMMDHVRRTRGILDDVRVKSEYAARTTMFDETTKQWRQVTEEERPDANPYWWGNRVNELARALSNIEAALTIARAELQRLNNI